MLQQEIDYSPYAAYYPRKTMRKFAGLRRERGGRVGSAPKRDTWAAMRGAVTFRAQPRAALVSVLMTASQLASRGGGVDNILATTQVRDRIDAGAVPLRIEADFVTCSQ